MHVDQLSIAIGDDQSSHLQCMCITFMKFDVKIASADLWFYIRDEGTYSLKCCDT